MKGFLSRLKAELLDLCDGKLGALTPDHVAFYRLEHDVGVELYCGWLGGYFVGVLLP